MNQEAIFYILEEISKFSLPTKVSMLKKRTLLHFKEKRKGLTKENINKKGLNIYEKRGIRFDSILMDLTRKKYINVELVYETLEEEVQLTSTGLEHLVFLYTNNHCKEFLSFEQAVNNLTKKHNETDFDSLHIASMYYNKQILSDIENQYFGSKSVQEEMEKYHKYLQSVYNLTPNKDDYLFHIMPRIFLPKEDMWEDVEFFAEGLELPNSIILKRPYPNQRYVVAGIENNEKKITTGFYFNLGNEKSAIKEKNICFHWKFGNGKTIIHDICIDFKLGRGQLFSSEQALNRSNNIPDIRMATFVGEYELFGGNREIEYRETEEDVLHLKEKVTLTSFQPRLHSCFWGDTSFEKWREEKRNIS